MLEKYHPQLADGCNLPTLCKPDGSLQRKPSDSKYGFYLLTSICLSIFFSWLTTLSKHKFQKSTMPKAFHFRESRFGWGPCGSCGKVTLAVPGFPRSALLPTPFFPRASRNSQLLGKNPAAEMWHLGGMSMQIRPLWSSRSANCESSFPALRSMSWAARPDRESVGRKRWAALHVADFRYIFVFFTKASGS